MQGLLSTIAMYTSNGLLLEMRVSMGTKSSKSWMTTGDVPGSRNSDFLKVLEHGQLGFARP
jgi:hypothetical protein